MAYTGIYLVVGAKETTNLQVAMKFSFGHVLPIYPGVRETRELMANVMFGEAYINAPWWLSFVTASQYLVSSALLFLFFLALRNRFKS